MPSVPARIRALACSLVAVALLLLSAGGAQASDRCDRVAAPSGSDDGAGTLARPYRTAQRLVESLSAGQTGCLRAGRYTEDVEIRSGGRAGAPLTVRGYPGEKATVIGQFEVHKQAPYVVVERLWLDGSGSRTSPIVNASDTTFRYNDVTDRHTGICFILGDSNGDWGRADRAVIERNRIHDCGRLPATNLDHGIYVEAATGARIEANWIYGNSDFGVHLYPDAQRTRVRGNMIDGNGMGMTFSGEGSQASSNNELAGNVISNSRERWNVESYFGSTVGRGNAARANCLYASNRRSYYNSHGGVTTESGGFSSGSNQVADPHYRNRSGADLRLAAGSACRSSFAGDPDFIPGPDGGPTAHPAAAPRRAAVRLAAKRFARRGGHAKLRGHVARSLVKPGQRARIYRRTKRHWRLVARVRVSRSGRFAARPRVRGHGRAVFRASVRRLGRSRAVHVRVRG